jgi:hypothetical protein
MSDQMIRVSDDAVVACVEQLGVVVLEVRLGKQSAIIQVALLELRSNRIVGEFSTNTKVFTL